MKRSILFLLTAILTLCAGIDSYAVADKLALQPPLHVKWTTKLKKENIFRRRPYQLASPMIDNGVLYVGSAKGIFYALKLENGHKIWNTKLIDGIYGEATADGDELYVADRKGNVYCLNKATGKIEWQVDTGVEISSKPIVTEDTVYFSTALKQIVALNKIGTGIKWQTTRVGTLPSMTIKGTSSPVLYNGNIYVGYGDGMFYCYNASDGSVVWSKQLSNKSSQFIDVDSTPLIIDGIIYVASVSGKTFALGASDGRSVWLADKGGANAVATDGDHIFTTGNGVLASLDKASGVQRWERNLNELEISQPVYKDGVIFVASTTDKIYIVDSGTGEIKYKRFLGKGTFGKPILEGSVLYILSNSSHVFALQGN